MRLMFITPAYKRFELTEIVFEQRARVCAKLAEYDVEANAIVIADDENLDIAKQWGFHIVEMDNDVGVAEKFNAGHRAAHALGAHYHVPVGSDTWLHDAWLPTHYSKGTVFYQRHYSIIDRLGQSRQQLWIDAYYGVHMCIETSLLKFCNWSPIPAFVDRGCDTATWNAIKDRAMFIASDKHPLEAIAFRSEEQISRDENLYAMWGIGTTEHSWAMLRDYYDDDLIWKMKNLYLGRDPEVGFLYQRLNQLERRLKKVEDGK